MITFENTTTEKTIEQAVAKYVPVAKIDELKNQFSGLTILGINDTHGYQTVKNALAQIVPVRTGIEKTRKELKQVALDYGKAVDSKAKELTDAVMAIENPLKAELERIDRLKADAEAELRRQAEAKLAERKKQILAAGALFNGTGYYLGALYYTEQQISDATDHDFTGIVSAIATQKLALAEIEAKEAEKRKAEQAELEELRKMRAEIEAKKAAYTNINNPLLSVDSELVATQTQTQPYKNPEREPQQLLTDDKQQECSVDFVATVPVEGRIVSEDYNKGQEDMREKVIELLKSSPFNAMPVTVSIIQKVKQL